MSTHTNRCYPERCYCSDEDEIDLGPRNKDIEARGGEPLGLFNAKGCPMCGGKVCLWSKTISEDNVPEFYGIGCVDIEACGVEMEGWVDKQAMIKHWNRRKP